MSTRLEDSFKNCTQNLATNVNNQSPRDAADSPPLDLKSPVLTGLRHRILPPPISMLLAFEDKLFAEGLTALIGPWNEFRLMATVTNNDEVLRYVLESRPALILMGARMQGVPCSETIRAIAAAAAQTRAVVICSYSESADVLDVLRAGAMGYGIREELSADRLRGFLWGVASGEIVLSNPICARLQDALSRPVDTPAVGNCFFDALTKREREVLALLVEGLSNAEIGQQLYLSEPTIKKIISQINSKLNTTNRVQAAVLATRHMPTRQE